MKLKPYMRGIGAGMIVAALVVGLSAPKGTPAKDEPKQTVLEASIEKQTVSDNDTASIVEEVKEKPQSATVKNEEPKKEEPIEEKPEEVRLEEVSSNEEDAPEVITPPAINPLEEDNPGFVDLGESIEIQVVRGDSSVSVSRRLYDAGLVESAVEFDNFLCSNGYDKSISVGTFKIAPGSDFETIAKTLSRRE